MTPSDATLSELLEETGPSTMGNRHVNDFESILPHSPLPFYTHFDASMLPLPSPVPSQQIDIGNNSTITHVTASNQKRSKPAIIQKRNIDQRFEEQTGVANKKHVPDSTKSLSQILKTQYKTPERTITPSPKASSRKNAKNSKKSCISKASQTTLSLPATNDSMESTRYTSMHMALMKLESMPKPEKKSTNSPAYVIKNQKERQMTLQNFNIDWSGMNKTEAQRYYNIHCSKQCKISEEYN